MLVPGDGGWAQPAQSAPAVVFLEKLGSKTSLHPIVARANQLSSAGEFKAPYVRKPAYLWT